MHSRVSLACFVGSVAAVVVVAAGCPTPVENGRDDRCGDGVRTGAEACDHDDLNGASCVSAGFSSGTLRCTDACALNTSACVPIACGNGVLDPGEGCDDANNVDGDGCDTNCSGTGCGNGIATAGEDCDDGNHTSGDGCSATCTDESAGEGEGEGGEGEGGE